MLDDVFWTVIPFGTGGRRGRMYPIGSNAINDRTIGESAQGLADYVKDDARRRGRRCRAPSPTTRGIARSTSPGCVPRSWWRPASRCISCKGIRSTPELSFLVRYKQCSCGIMVTASHNPPSDNAVKVYWSTGGQLLPPHDKGVIERVMTRRRSSRAVSTRCSPAGKIVVCQDEVDREVFRRGAVAGDAGAAGSEGHLLAAARRRGDGGGAGAGGGRLQGGRNLRPAREAGRRFSECAGACVESRKTRRCSTRSSRGRKEAGADLALATDPDCDRIGCAAPLTFAQGCAVADAHRQSDRRAAGRLRARELRSRPGELSPQHFIVDTLVTTQLIRRIGDSYGVRTIGDLLVGFKWIAGAIDEYGPEQFVYGTEESHGYMAGTLRPRQGRRAWRRCCCASWRRS